MRKHLRYASAELKQLKPGLSKARLDLMDSVLGLRALALQRVDHLVRVLALGFLFPTKTIHIGPNLVHGLLLPHHLVSRLLNKIEQ